MKDIRFFEYNLKFLMILGLWKSEALTRPTLIFIYDIYSMSIFIFFVMFNISELIEMFKILFTNFDILLLMANMIVTLLYIMSVLKAYTMKFRKHDMQKILNIVKRAEDNLYFSSTEECKLYEESIKRSKFISKFFLIMCSTTLAGFHLARPAEYLILGPKEEYNYKAPILFRYKY